MQLIEAPVDPSPSVAFHLEVEPARRAPRWPIGLAVACLALTQAPWAAYTQNQNTYLVRAVAGTTAPGLQTDRLVQSSDPVPMFTALVKPLIAVADGPALLYAAWGLAAAAFVASLWSIGGIGRRPRTLLMWAAALGVLGSPALGLLDATPLARPLEGVALQYALGPVLQPSVAGVLLLGAVAVRLGRLAPWPVAVALAFGAAFVHPSYLPASGIVFVALLVVDLMDGSRAREILAVVAQAGGAIAVVGIGNLSSYRAALDPAADRANEVLAYERIPHHAVPSQWLDLRTLVVLAIVSATGWAASRPSRSQRDRRFGRFLLVATVLTAVATVGVAVLAVPSLLLTFPWRASVVLVPMATAWLVARLVEVADQHIRTDARRVVAVASGAMVSVAVLAGLRVTQTSAEPEARGPLVRAIHDQSVSGEGLIPTGRTTHSDAQLVDDVRLNAGVPIYVDWKNNPNEPAAVLAWRQRLDRADDAMTDPTALCDLVDEEQLAWVAVPDAVAAAPCLASWTTTPVGDLQLRVRH